MQKHRFSKCQGVFGTFFATLQFCRSARRNWRAQLPGDFPDESLGTTRHTIHLFSMVTELTVAQREVLHFLEDRSEKSERPPTYREICKRFGYKSPKAAFDHVVGLEKKGFLTRQKGLARGLNLVRKS